jgi:hypothetical protein
MKSVTQIGSGVIYNQAFNAHRHSTLRRRP